VEKPSSNASNDAGNEAKRQDAQCEGTPEPPHWLRGLLRRIFKRPVKITSVTTVTLTPAVPPGELVTPKKIVQAALDKLPPQVLNNLVAAIKQEVREEKPPPDCPCPYCRIDRSLVDKQPIELDFEPLNPRPVEGLEEAVNDLAQFLTQPGQTSQPGQITAHGLTTIHRTLRQLDHLVQYTTVRYEREHPARTRREQQ
jgi:hypothetical protein